MKRILKLIWRYWKKFGLFLGHVIGTIISILLYIFFITPFAVVIKITTDYFNIKSKRESNWTPKVIKNTNLQDMRKLY